MLQHRPSYVNTDTLPTAVYSPPDHIGQPYNGPACISGLPPLPHPAPRSPHCMHWLTLGICKQPCTKHMLPASPQPTVHQTVARPLRGSCRASCHCLPSSAVWLWSVRPSREREVEPRSLVCAARAAGRWLRQGHALQSLSWISQDQQRCLLRIPVYSQN